MGRLPFEADLLDALSAGRDVTRLGRVLTLVGAGGGTLIVAAFLAPYTLAAEDALTRWAPWGAMALLLLPLWLHATRVALGTRARLVDLGLELRPLTDPPSIAPWPELVRSGVRGGFVDVEWRDQKSAIRRSRFFVGPSAWAHRVVEEIDRRASAAARSTATADET